MATTRLALTLQRKRFVLTQSHPFQRPLERDEWALLARVHRELDMDPRLNLDDVDIEIQGQTLVLRGSVPSELTRSRIAHTVALVEGVEGVDNQLAVPRAIVAGAELAR